MTAKKLNKEEKQAELIKFRDLLIATLVYYLDNEVMKIKTADFDSNEYYKGMKAQIQEHFLKGRLGKLKQWFRDLTEMPIEARNLKFNKYLHDKTGYEIDIFKSFFQRVDKIIEKGKIETDNQFYEINIMVDHLCQAELPDKKQIDILNDLLGKYEQQKSS